MAAVAPYIPTRQNLFDAWFLNFSTLISASPALYGLTPGDAVAIAALYSAWHAAYLPVTSATTKTAATVAAKNGAYASVLPQVRQYSQQITNNAGVTSANKISLGLNPKTSTPSPITPPASTPVLSVQSAVAGAITLRYRDSASGPSVKAKPYGVTQCRICGMVSATAVVDPLVLPVLAVATKSPFLLNTAGLAKGSTIYLAAYWMTRKGLTSGPSPIISTTVV